MDLRNELSGRFSIVIAILLAASVSLVVFLSGCSTSSSNTTTTPPPSGTVNFIYTANGAGNPSTVSALVSNVTTGALTPISGSPYNAGTGSLAVRAEPAGKFLYTANYFSGDISGFSIASTTGALTPMPAPFAAEPGMDAIAIDPTGKFLYAVTGTLPNLWAFSIDSSTGALSALSGSSLLIDPAASSSGAIAIDPSGKYLFAAAPSTGLYAFTRDTATGALMPVAGSPFPVDVSTHAITTDPAGKFVIAVSTGHSTLFGTVSVFSLDSTTGILTPISGSPFHTGVDPSSVTVDPSGKFVYTANTADATLSAFTLNASTGALNPISGSPFPSGGNGTINGPTGIVVDPSGQSVYVCNASNDISVFKINAQNGALTAIASSPFVAGGSGPSGIAVIQKK